MQKLETRERISSFLVFRFERVLFPVARVPRAPILFIIRGFSGVFEASLLSGEFSNNTRGIPTYNRPGRHITGDHASGPYDCAFAHSNALGDNRTGANPGLVPDYHRLLLDVAPVFPAVHPIAHIIFSFVKN
jgi:hypothetical protein